jgi:hypothetical protein
MYSPLGLGEAQAFSSAKIEPINPTSGGWGDSLAYWHWTKAATTIKTTQWTKT